MNAHLRSHLILIGGTLVLCCGVYPLAVWGFAQSVAPASANGSLVFGPDGAPVGSALIAQEFKGEAYLHSRPSAAGYNGGASSGSNYGANNPKLRERVESQLAAEYPATPSVPADAVTASGSGLDPHLTPRSALAQAPRLATARRRSLAEIASLLTESSFVPLSGLNGEPLVNVLEANRLMDARFPQ